MREGLHPVRWAREWASSGRLSKPEGDVLKELASYTGDAPVAWPSNDTLAQAIQCVEKTVKAALAGLEEKGLISRERNAAGRVLRSREHPIVLVVEIVATPAAGQLQLELGDEALVTADPQPRRRPAAPAVVPAVAPGADENELARKRREKIAADAAHVGATLHALNASAATASDDPGLPTTRGEGRQETPEVPGKIHVQTEEERERASAPADTSQNTDAALSPKHAEVMRVLRAEFGAQADLMEAAIDTTLRGFPDGDHVAAAHMVVAAQQTAAVMGYAPIKVLSAKLGAELRKQAVSPPAGWPPRRRGATHRRGTAAELGMEHPTAKRMVDDAYRRLMGSGA